jgi:hypothetical protein
LRNKRESFPEKMSETEVEVSKESNVNWSPRSLEHHEDKTP